MKIYIKALFFYFCLSLPAIQNVGNAQNPWFSLPNQIYKVGANNTVPLTVSTIPGDYYDGLPANYSHNAMTDANDELLFFVVDGALYDKDGYLMNYISTGGNTIPGVGELTIVPQPGNCDRFYIFTGGISNGGQGTVKDPFYSVLDLTLPGAYHPGRFGDLEVLSNGDYSMNLSGIIG